MRKETLAIAVDFGTTYSGVAYRPTDNVDPEPTQLGRWPGQPPIRASFKVPTIVAYPADPSSLAPVLWGYEAERLTSNAYVQVRAFKPYLDPAATHEFTGPAGKSLADVVRDFLQGVYEHLVRELSGQGLSTDLYDYHVLFTVPAPFNTATVEAFKRIVNSTGWSHHTVQMELTEPEAAALHTLHTQRVLLDRLGMERNKCFIVCDAGGGTVDLASYSISQRVPSIRLAQTGVVTGDVCGSTLIDHAFKQFIKNEMGEYAFKMLSNTEKTSLVDEFIAKKEWFEDVAHQNTIALRLPPEVTCLGQRGGFLSIERRQMKNFFESPVSRTCQLVVEHVLECNDKGYQVSYVFLVGGFGTSPYLKERLTAELHPLRNGCTIITPRHAEQAVVLGCLYTHLQRLGNKEDPVSQRLCRANIGVVALRRFDPAVHSREDRWEHPVTGQVLASNQILWLVKKGDVITSAVHEVEHGLVRSFEKRIREEWREQLVCSTLDQPPTRMTSDVRKVCALTSDLRQCSLSEFEKKKRPTSSWCFRRHKTYYEADYTVKLMISTADLRFEMRFGNQVRSDLLRVAWEELRDGKV